MKILILNRSDLSGGAAKAAYRLHRGLLMNNIDSQMLVMKKVSDDFTVIKSPKQNNNYFLDKLVLKFYPKKKRGVFSSGITSSDLLKTINKINPDIVHLHWINNGFLSIKDLGKIKQPIVWSLHDLWAFTGGCHYDADCGKYSESCGKCPYLKSKTKFDLSTWIYKRKKRAYKKQNNITPVGLSKWIGNCSVNSSLFSNFKTAFLPNGIDTVQYKPMDKNYCREILNLPKDKKLILFGAVDPTSSIRKGFSYLKDAFLKIKNEDIEIVIFGSSEPEKPFDFGLKSHYLGRFSDDYTLSLIYSAADTLVLPSLQENLSNVVMESLASGTPVVAFDIGGNGDMIKDKVNGCLVEAFSSEKLAEALLWITSDKERLKILSDQARKTVVENFDLKEVAQKYINLYLQILESKN